MGTIATSINGHQPGQEVPVAHRDVENIYELSPMQQGMLFHTLRSPNSGTYIEQSAFSISGELDQSLFAQAWRRIVERHSIFRTSFLWEDMEKPLQIVHRRADLPLDVQDWQHLHEDEQREQLAQLSNRERQRGFELGKAPLMRLVLIRVAAAEYKFIWSRHHILLDRWSRSLVLRELSALYQQLCAGEESEPKRPRPFADYIAWLHQQNASASEACWRKALRGFTAPTRLGIEQANTSPGQGGTYESTWITISHSTTDALKAIARQRKLTMNTIVQGAWALLLRRYSGEDRVMFGATSSGRPAELTGVESMVGLFINTLPVPIEIPPNHELISWLHGIQDQQLEQRQYENSSLIDIQGWSDIPRGLPLFHSILVFENVPVFDSGQTGPTTLRMQSEGEAGARTGYPLTVLVSPGAELSVGIVYDAGQLETAAVHRLAKNLGSLFESIAKNPEQRVSDVSALTAAERDQLILDWNRTTDAREELLLKDRFEQQADRTPDATAVLYQRNEFTYRDINIRANKLARYLARRGAGPEVLVGICMERSVDMLISVLAVLKSGAAYVPLDPEYPRERLLFMLKDSGAAVLLTQQRLTKRLPVETLQTIYVDSDWDEIADESADDIETRVGPDNLAYVIYTSGSTGRPKGVAMTHHPLANLIAWQMRRSSVSRDARTVQFASLSFDVSFQEIFSTWCSGGTLVLISEDLRRDSGGLLRLLHDESIERLFLPFVALQQLAEAVQRGGQAPHELREIITAGEQLELTPHITALLDVLESCTLYNQYGPSESHVATEFTVARGRRNEPLPPIGRPIQDAEIYLLDKHLHPVPIGATGELCIGGTVLCRGYMDRPDLTAERFVPSPFGASGGRLYRTGDLARYRSNGDLEFLGRIDNQLKIRGFRVEPGELECILRLHPAVREVAVVAREASLRGKSLAAYVVGTDHGSLIPELRSMLKQRVAEYMVPSTFCILDAMPLTPSGKVDRKALAAIQTPAELPQKPAGPRDPLEAQLVEIWEELLGVSPVSRTDDFFDLGGHSLLAVRLMDRIEQTYGKKLPLTTLYSGATVEHLGQALLTQEGAALQSPMVPIKTGGTKRPFFFLHGDFNGGGFYSLNLARYLDDDQPFYILHPHGLDGKQVPDTIEAMAASRLELLRRYQPTGPYMLGGFCNGALAAFEMARLLEADGHKVDLLVLIDASAANTKFKVLRQLITRLGSVFGLDRDEQFFWFLRLREHYLRLSRMSKRQRAAYVLKNARKLSRRLAPRFITSEHTARDAHSTLSDRTSEAAFRHNDEINLRYARAVWGYIPQSYAGAVKLFCPSERPATASDDPANGWRTVAPNVDVHVIPGNHLTAITKYGKLMAEQLNACIREAQSTSRTEPT